MIRGLAAAALALIACGESQPALSLVLDLPPESSAAYPFAGVVDTLRISVARAGSEVDLRSLETAVDGELVLDDVPFGDDLVVHLSGEVAGTEVAYGRTCSFDIADGAVPGEVHLYFSRLVQFGPGPAAVVPDRIDGHAFVRANNSVVVAGGREAAPLEIFNPILGELGEVEEASMTVARDGGELASLGVDHAIIVGGTAGAAPVERIETLPDLRDSIDSGLSLRGHQVAGLVGDLAVVIGGEAWLGDRFEVTAEAFEFEVEASGLVESAKPVGPLLSARTRHTATRLSNEPGASVLVAGGVDQAGQAVSTVEVYRPLAESFVELPLATLSRFDHQAVGLAGGAVAIVGGFTIDGVGASVAAIDVELFDPVEGRFFVAGTMPANSPVTGFSTTLLPDGRALITGGRDEGGVLLDAALIIDLDPFNGEVNVTPTDSLAVARTDHTAVLVCDGTVLVIGGESSSGVPPVERYNPPSANRR